MEALPIRLSTGRPPISARHVELGGHGPILGAVLHIEVERTAGCPHAAAVIQRIEDLAARRDDLHLVVVEVGPNQPVPATFAGSPTVLIDGANPFGGTSVDTPACALHPPTPDQVDDAISRH